MNQASITVDIQARISNLKDILAQMQKDVEKLDLGSSLGKNLKREISSAQKQLETLGRNTNVRLTSEGGIDSLTNKIENIISKIQDIGGEMQKVTFKDVNSELLENALKTIRAEWQKTKQEFEEKVNLGLVEDLKKAPQLKKYLEQLGTDFEHFDAITTKNTLEENLEKAGEEAKQAAIELGRLQEVYKKAKEASSQYQAEMNKGGSFYSRLKEGISSIDKTNFSVEEVINTRVLNLKIQEWEKSIDGLNKYTDEEKNQFKLLLEDYFNVSSIKNIASVADFRVLISNFKKDFESIFKILGAEGAPKDFYKTIFGSESLLSDTAIKKLFELDPAAIEAGKKLISETLKQFDINKLGEKEVNKINLLLDKNDIENAAKATITLLRSKFDEITQEGQRLERESADALGQVRAGGLKSARASNAENTARNRYQEFLERIKILEENNKDLQEQIKELERRLNGEKENFLSGIKNTGKNSSQKSSNELKAVLRDAQAYKKELEQIQAKQQLVGKIEGVVQRWFSIYAAVRMVGNAIRSVISTVQELDKTITEIAIVTNMTQDELWGQMKSYTDMARQYAASISGVYQVSQLYYQQGLQTADVMALTEETLKMARISGLGYAEATDYMTNAVRSFKMEMTDAQRVVDVYSEIAASSATSTSELASAMSKTASSAEAVGSSFENTTAMMAVMIEATRESAENIGSAMKSIISRYGEMTANPAKLMDSEGQEMSLNKVDKALRSVGITIQDSNHQFRDFDEVITELAGKWNTIDTNTQRYIATVMAGNRQQSRFLALVSNGERLTELSEKAANSEDAATLQVLKTMDSIEAKTQQFKTSLQSLYTDTGVQNFFKGILDLGNNVVKTFTEMPRIFNLPIPAIVKFGTQFYTLSSVVLNAFSMIKIGLNKKMSETSLLLKAAQQEELTQAEQTALNRILTEQRKQKGILDAQRQGEQARLADQKASDQAQIDEANAAARQQADAANKALTKRKRAQIGGMAASTAGLVLSTVAGNMDITQNRGLKAGLTGVSAALQGLGTGLMLGGVPGAIMGAFSSLPGIIEAIGMASESTEEKINRFNSAIEETSNKKLQSKDELKTLTDYKKQYDELAKTRYKDAESREEWIKLNNEIAANYPELIASMNEEGNYVVNMTSAYESLAAAKSKTYRQDFIKNLHAELNGLTDLDYILAKYYGTSVLKGPDSYWSISSTNDPNLKAIGNQYQDYLKNRTQGQAFSYNGRALDAYSHAAATYSEIFNVSKEELQGRSQENVLANYSVQYDQIINLMAGYAEQNMSRFEAAQKLLEEHPEFVDLSQYVNNFNDTLFNYFKFAATGINYEDELIKQAYKNNTQEWIHSLSELTGINANSAQFGALTDSANKLWNKYLKNESKNGKHKIGDLVTNEDGTSFVWTEANIFENFITDVLSPTWYKTQVENVLTDYKDETVNEIYQNIGKYRHDDIKFGTGIFANYSQDIRQTLLNAFNEQYSEIIQNFKEGLKNSAEKAGISKQFNIVEDLSEIIGPEYQDAVLGQFDTFLNDSSISTDTKNNLFKQLSELYFSINRGLEGEELNQVMTLATSADFTNLTGIYNFLDELSKLGIDLTAGKLKGIEHSDIGGHIEELLNFINVNLTTEFETFSQSIISESENFEKALNNAQKGMDLKTASEMANKLNLSLKDFRFEGGKYFYDNAQELQKAYLNYNKELKNKLESDADNLTALFSTQYHWTNDNHENKKDQSILDLMSESTNEDWLGESLDARIAYIQKLTGLEKEEAEEVVNYYDRYIKAWEQSGKKESFGDFVIDDIKNSRDSAEEALDNYTEYQINAFLIQNGQIQDFLASVMGDTWSHMDQRDQKALISQITSGNFADLDENIKPYISELWSYIQNAQKDVFDKAITSIKGGKQLIKKDSKNETFLKKYGKEAGDGINYWLDLTVDNLTELQQDILAAIENGSITKEEGNDFLKKIQDIKYEDNIYTALSEIVDSYDNFSYEVGQKLTNVLGTSVENLVANEVFKIDSAGNISTSYEELIKQLNNALFSKLIDNKQYAELRGKLEQQKIDLDPDNIIRGIITERDKISTAAIGQLADAMNTTYGRVIQDLNLQQNDDGTYRMSLDTLWNQFAGQMNDTLTEYVASEIDKVISSMTNLSADQSKGYTSVESIQKYADSLKQQGIKKIDGTDFDLKDLFEYNDTLQAYQLTTIGIIAQIASVKKQIQPLIGEQRAIAEQFMQNTAKQFADNIDLQSLVNADLGSVEAVKATTLIIKAVDNYNSVLKAMAEEGEKVATIDADALIESIGAGGEAAVIAAQKIAELQGKTLSADEIEGYYRREIQHYVNVIDQVTARPGEIVDAITASIIGLNNVDQLGTTGQYVVKSAANLYEAYNKLLQRMAATGEATLADLNKVAALALENRDGEQQVIDALGDAAGMTFTRFGEILANAGIQLTEDMVNDLEASDIIDLMGGNKMKIVDFQAFADLMQWDANSEEYISAFKSYNDSLIEMNRQAERNILEEAESIADAKGGDWINLTQMYDKIFEPLQKQVVSVQQTGGNAPIITTAFDKLNRVLKGYGANLEDGILKLDDSANISAIMQEITRAAAESGGLLSSELAELADTVADVIKGYADLISGAISGSLSNAQAEQLQDWASTNGIGKLNFTETANGLKVATDQAFELVAVLRQVDSMQGKLTFDKLVDSLSADKGGTFENISKTTAEIAKAQREIAENNQKIDFLQKDDEKTNAKSIQALKDKNAKLREQIGLYREIQQRQSIDPAQYNFMDRDLPDIMQGPINYWNSVGQAYSALNETAQTGKMDIQDFTNIVNEMSNLAATSGEKLTFFGQEIDGSAENAAALIQKGYGALSNIDGKGVKVDLSKMGIDFAAGADNAKNNFDKGIHSLAESQVAMLDAAIQVLEVVVAMEELGNIDVDNNGIFSIGDIFGEQVTVGNGEKIDAYTTEFQDYAQRILKAAETNEDLRKGLENFSVNGVSLKEMFEDATDRLKDLNISKEAYFAIMNSFVKAAKNGDYNLDTIQDSVWEILEQTLPDGSVIDIGERSIVISGGTHLIINWEDPDVQKVVDEIKNKEHKTEEEAKQQLTEDFSAYQNNTANTIQVERVLTAKGIIKTNTENGGVDINGQHFATVDSQEAQEAIAKAALKDKGIENIKEINTTKNGDAWEVTASGIITVGEQKITVNYDDGAISYHSNITGQDYSSVEELFHAEFKEVNKHGMAGYETEEEYVKVTYGAKIAAELYSEGIKIENEEDFKNRTQQEVNDLAAALVNGSDEQVVKAAEKVGIKVDIEGELTAEQRAQIAELAGITSETKALNLSINVSGDGAEIAQKVLETESLTSNLEINPDSAKDTLDSFVSDEIESEKKKPVDLDITKAKTTLSSLTSSIEETVDKYADIYINYTQQYKDALADITKDVDKTVNIKTKGTVNAGPGPKAGGNVALATGTGNAYSAGNTLMGELGPEMVVSHGRYFVVGQNGPEMVNLAEDAIVFNHLQTEQLLRYGKASGHAKPVTNERKATSLAAGNVGPAMASASAALDALKQLRSMWQSLLNASLKDLGGLAGGSGGGGGGGGGGNDDATKGVLGNIERWYNYLQDIEQTQVKINKLTKEYTLLEKQGASSKARLKNLQDEYDLLERNKEIRDDLVEQQTKYRTTLLKKVNKGKGAYGLLSAFYSGDLETGTLTLKNDKAFQEFVKKRGAGKTLKGKGIEVNKRSFYSEEEAEEENKKREKYNKDNEKAIKNGEKKAKKTVKAGDVKGSKKSYFKATGGLELFDKLQKTDQYGNLVYSADDQLKILEDLGFGAYLKKDASGNKLKTAEEKVEYFFSQIDSSKGEIEALTDSINDQEQAALDDSISMQEINEQIREIYQTVPGVNEGLDKWYNYTRKIADEQNRLNKLTKENANLQKDQIGNGQEIYENYKQQLASLENSVKLNDNYLKAREKEADNLAENAGSLMNLYTKTDSNSYIFDESSLKKLGPISYKTEAQVKTNTLGYKIDEKGQYVDNKGVLRDEKGKRVKNGEYGLDQVTESEKATFDTSGNIIDVINRLTAQDATGKVALAASEQYQIIKKMGLEEFIKYDENGSEIYSSFGEMSKEEQQKAVEVGINRIRETITELNENNDEIVKLEESNLDINSQILDVQNALRDNSINVQNMMRDAIVQEHQDAIDQKKELTDAIKNAADKTISGLKDSLEKEKNVYDSDQDEKELTLLQMQLSTARVSGNSASKVLDLQKQIAEKQKEIYFNERQASINDLEDATNKQVEELEEQTNIMQSVLDYQVKYGLIWEKVNQKLAENSTEAIVNYILKNSPDYVKANIDEQTKTLIDKLDVVGLYKSQTEDEKQNQQTGVSSPQPEVTTQTTDEVKIEDSATKKKTAVQNALNNLKTNKDFKGIKDAQTLLSSKEILNVANQAYDNSKATNDEDRQKAVEKVVYNEVNKKLYSFTPAGVWEDFQTKYSGLLNLLNENQLKDLRNFSKRTYNSSKKKTLEGKAQETMSKTLNRLEYITQQLKKRSQVTQYNSNGVPISFRKYASGGEINFTGPAWVDGSKTKPEQIFNFEQMKQLKTMFLDNLATTQMGILGLSSITDNLPNTNSYNNINNEDNGVSINQLDFHMEVQEIGDGYDARQAGREAMEEIVRIARKSGNRSISRR